MLLLIARHGNTFGPDQDGGERVFMSGSKNNIPLVESGRQQARDLAEYLDKLDIIPNVIYANHLIRTWEFGALIKEYFHFNTNLEIPLVKNDSLLELDYGSWAGLTTNGATAKTNAVIANFGLKAWNDWQQRRVILNHQPHNWQMTKLEVIENLQLFLDTIASNHDDDDIVLAISSQGTMGFINELVGISMEQAISESHYKVNTGRFCELFHNADGWVLNSWNNKALP